MNLVPVCNVFKWVIYTATGISKLRIEHCGWSVLLVVTKNTKYESITYSTLLDSLVFIP